jgi:transcriptional regulator with XRE-family HTH domain
MNSVSGELIPTTGKLVALRRQSLGISQQGLADLAGISVHTLSNLEGGKGNPSLKVLERLLDCLGLQIIIEPRSPRATSPVAHSLVQLV